MLTKMGWATSLAIFLQTYLVTLVESHSGRPCNIKGKCANRFQKKRLGKIASLS
jgi:hypothetical protein